MIGYDRLQGIFTVGLILYRLWTDIQVVVVVFLGHFNFLMPIFPSLHLDYIYCPPTVSQS